MLREVSIPEISGRLFLSRMPGRRGPFAEESREIVEHGIDMVVSLTSLEEISEKSPGYAEAIRADALPWKGRVFPIQDFGIPTDREAFLHLARSIAADLQTGRRILIHCGAGVGRTGMLAVCVLMALGMEKRSAWESVDAAGSRPEAKDQCKLVRWASEVLREQKN